MATYIKGSTPYIPQVQPFRPDFNFFNKALQMKQGKYDQAHEQLSTLYGSLLNAPMLRDSNIQSRDQFFKAIDQDIHKISGMDLSLQQNVTAASGLFNQLLDNTDIVNDMVKTKMYYNEKKRADGFRDCVDPEKCGGSWWEGGDRALDYWAQEFKEANSDEAMGMGGPRFVAYQDMMGEAIKLAKDAGLSITMDQLQGGYITTTKNGPQLVGPLANLFMGKFAKDPKYLDYYKTKAYVDRKDWVNSNAQTYGSIEAAENAYIQEVGNMFAPQIDQTEKDLDQNLKHTEAQRKQLEEKMQDPGSTRVSTLAEQYEKMGMMEQAIRESHDAAKIANGSLKVGLGRGASRAAFANIDNAIAMMHMGNDINSVAGTLAFKDYEFKMKEDPYSMEGYRQANRIALESMRHRNRMELELYKKELDYEFEQRAAMGTNMDNIPTVVGDVPGSADVSIEKEDPNKFGQQTGYEQFQEEREDILKDISAPQKQVLQQFTALTQQKSKAEGGAGAASQDLLKIADYYYSQSWTGDPWNASSGLRAYNDWKKLSPEEKLIKAQNEDFSRISGTKMSNTSLNDFYSNVVLPSMDMNNQANQVNRDYLKPLWKESQQARLAIARQSESLQQLDNWFAEESKNIVAKMRADSGFAKYADLMEHYVDPRTGRIRTEEEFARSYASTRANYDAAYKHAKNMYRHDKQLAPGIGDYATSAADAVGTTVLGVGELVKDVFMTVPSIVGKGWLWGDYQDFFDRGFDYDLPTDVANWAAKDNDGRANQGLHDIYKRAFHKFADPKGGYHYLGVTGLGDEVAQAINFAMVDPAKYKSNGTMNTVAFMKDFVGAGKDGARAKFGGFSNSVPGNTSDKEAAVVQQVITDLIMRNTVKDKNRPILNVTYSDIAGSNEDWTALNFKLNSNYVKQFLGSKANPGLMRSVQSQLTGSGMTLYLKKNNASNGFRMNSQNTDVDRVLEYSGKYNLDIYPEYTKDFTLNKTDQGTYYVSGSYMAGIDDNGAPIWQPHYHAYNSPLTEAAQIVEDYRAILNEMALGNQTLIQQYNQLHRGAR